MALARYEGTAVDTAGNVIPNATVEVRRDQPGRPVVPLWGDREGTVALGNPIQTDAQGGFGFHVTGGVYYIRIFTGPSQQPTFQKVLRYVGIGTAAERDVEDLASALETGTATFPTLPELEAFTPSDVSVGGKVTTGEDAGFYHYDTVEEEWIFDRPLYDTLARMNVTGGTADAIEAEVAAGVDSASVVMLFFEPDATNTGPVTINGMPLLSAGGISLGAGELIEGRTYWFTDEGTNYKLRPASSVVGIEVGDVDTLPPGEDVVVTSTPTPGGFRLDFGIPSGEGFVFRGAYNGATDYVLGDVATQAGSAWILTSDTSTGNPPPALPNTSNAYWNLMARKGDDGTIASLVEGEGISIDSSDPANPIISADAQPLTLVAGEGVDIDDTNPEEPVISVNTGTVIIGGRLSLVSGDPLPEADVVGASIVYLVPALTNYSSLWNGALWKLYEFTQLTLSLVASHLADNNYDVWEFDDAGSLAIGTGPSWADGAVAGSLVLRGTGAGSTELELFHGRIVNKVAMTLRNGATTYAVAARAARLRGTISMTANGVTEDSMIKRFVSNLFNPEPRPMRRHDSANSWTYSTAAWRQANNNVLNRVQYVQCVAGRRSQVSVGGLVFNSTSTLRNAAVGIGINSSTVNSATRVLGSVVGAFFGDVSANYIGYPGLGRQAFNWLEYGAGTDTQTWVGDYDQPNYFQTGIEAETLL